jgi:hypothetical protein
MKEPTTEGWRSQLFWGASIAIVAAGCGIVDGINNYTFGIAISSMSAAVMLFAAALVIAVPAFAAYRGWDWLKAGVLATALALTVWAAASSYGTSQAGLHTATQDRQDHYRRASEKRQKATETLAAIKETGQAVELAKLADQADARFDEANTTWARSCKKAWLDICTTATAEKKAAEAKQTAARQRLSDAKSRDKASADIESAEAIMNAGQTVIREENPALVWLSIALTQGGALLGGEGFALLLLGMAGRKTWKQSRRKKARTETAPDGGGGTKQPLPGNVVSMTARRSVDTWANAHLASEIGGEVRGSDIHRAYKRWKEHDPSITSAEMKEILATVLKDGKGKVVMRTSGWTVRGSKLVSSQTQAKKKAAAR